MLITILPCLLGSKYLIQSGGFPVDPLSPLEFHSHLARGLRHTPTKRSKQILSWKQALVLVEEQAQFHFYFLARMKWALFSSPVDSPLAEVESKRGQRQTRLGVLLAMPASVPELHSTVQQQTGPGQSSVRTYLIC